MQFFILILISTCSITIHGTDEGICELCADQELKAIMGWEGEISKSDDSFGKRTKICTITHGEETLSIRKNFSSEKSQQKNPDKIKKRFKKYLDEGENHLVYGAIEINGSNEMIFGEGPMQYGLHNYILRYRKGEEYQLILEVSGPGKDVEGMKERLISLIRLVEE